MIPLTLDMVMIALPFLQPPSTCLTIWRAADWQVRKVPLEKGEGGREGR